MIFKDKLIKGTFIKRYKRFFVDVALEDGSVVTAHCPNTGSMKSCFEEGAVVYLSPAAEGSTRKLLYTWELIQNSAGFVGVHTGRINGIVEEGLQKGAFKELRGYSGIQREVKFKDSRIDFKLTDPSKKDCWVEVKSVTYFDQNKNCCSFPDAVTARGAKHLRDLMELKSEGFDSVILFLINRPEGRYFTPAAEIDPLYASLLEKAALSGVKVLVYRSSCSLEGILVKEEVSCKL